VRAARVTRARGNKAGRYVDMAIVKRCRDAERAIFSGEIAMRTRRLEQTALTTFLIASCVMFLFAAFAAQAHNTPAAPPELPAVSVHHNI